MSNMTWIPQQISDLPALLADVRRRPAVWMGRKSIECLHMMLVGIEFAEDWHAISSDARFGGFDFGAFEIWVEQTHNPQKLSVRSFGLSAIVAGSDDSGFDLWFRWYDDFLAQMVNEASSKS